LFGADRRRVTVADLRAGFFEGGSCVTLAFNGLSLRGDGGFQKSKKAVCLEGQTAWIRMQDESAWCCRQAGRISKDTVPGKANAIS
jgi:hypothetical protein